MGKALAVLLISLAILNFPTNNALAYSLNSLPNEIILSKGTTIHRLADPSKLPTHFATIKQDSLLFPVPAGQFLLKFPTKYSLKADGSFRDLVLTESGLWGYIARNNRTYAAEPRLRAIATSGEPHAIFETNFKLTILADRGPITFTRGEIVGISEMDGNRPTKIRIPEDKRQDLARFWQIDVSRTPEFIEVPKDSPLELIDISPFISDRFNISKNGKPSSREYGYLYDVWKKFEFLDVEFSKPCDTDFESITRTKTGLQGEISISVLTTWVASTFGVDLGGGFTASTSFERLINVMKSMDTHVSAYNMNWQLEYDGIKKYYLINKVGNCDNTEHYEIITPKASHWRFHNDFYNELLSPPMNAQVSPYSGVITMECYKQDYLRISNILSRKLNMYTFEVDFVLSNIAQIQDWTTFFDC